MQGTVSSYDAETRCGQLLTDEGIPMDFGAETLAEHIRHLRVGQRVFIESAGTTITAIKIWNQR